MIIAIDVLYKNNSARIVAAEFEKWYDGVVKQLYITTKFDIEDYEPGAFYKRELPCIIEILKQIDLSKVEYIIIDGYVYLNDEGKKGLGYYVYEYFNEKIPIIGVAKSHFFNNLKFVKPILRGKSQTPLYITAIGIELDIAAQNIKEMHGDFRMPTILKQVDSLTKAQ